VTIKVFLDCEFTEFEQPKLISIALVTENNERSFYAELTNTYTINDCSEFVVSIVLPLLDAKPLTLPLTDYTNVYARMSFDECRIHLMKWFELLNDESCIFNDVPQFDFTLLSSLFVEQWPEQLSLYCETICSSTADGEELYEKSTIQLFKNGFREHHSLDDARVMSKAYHAMQVSGIKTASQQYITSVGLKHLSNRKIQNN